MYKINVSRIDVVVVVCSSFAGKGKLARRETY